MKILSDSPFRARTLLLIPILFLHLSLTAQLQWYQNQDGNNQYPDGTTAISVQPFGSTSFIVCYLWTINNDDYTWKISRTKMNGTEIKTFFVTGVTAQVEVKAGTDNHVYVLKKNFPIGQNPEFVVYKLDANLVVKKQMTLSLPNGFNIINLNAFETDASNNVYLAGDGQYLNGQGFGYASFVLKTNKDFVTKWKWMDSTQTSFTRIHTEPSGDVTVVDDFYTFFPDLRLHRISANGQHVSHFTIETDPGRFTLNSSMDDHDNLLFYGIKSIGDTAQGMYLYKFSRQRGRIVYRKTHFVAAGLQLYDFKVDPAGNIFSLADQYSDSGERVNKISRISSRTGNILWNRNLPFSEDSCNLVKLVITDHDRLYALGSRQSNNYFFKGYALRLNKYGHQEGSIAAPDSVCYQRLHWLSDGILSGPNKRLIAVGGTSDLDTVSFSSNYLKAFAVRFLEQNNKHTERPGAGRAKHDEIKNDSEPEDISLTNSLQVYPNPVTVQMTISGLDKDEYEMLSVYNMQGGRVLHQSIRGPVTRINVSNLPEGMYVLVLHSRGQAKERSLKILVSR